MEIQELMPHIEALLFVSDRALPALELLEYMNNVFPEEVISGEQINVVIDSIIEKYAAPYYPFEIKAINGGYLFLTKKEYHQTVLQLNGDKHLKKLSAAAMETLSIIAYKQPITKSDIEYIRGVSSDYSIQKLLEKELIVIAGRKEEAVGKPLIYATSRSFMDYLGINTVEELPKLKEIVAIDAVMPSDSAAALPEDLLPQNEPEGLSGMVVDDKGALHE